MTKSFFSENMIGLCVQELFLPLGNFLPPSHFVYGCFAPTKAPITQHSVTMTKTNKNKNKYKDSITERIEGAKGKYFSNHFQICQIFPDCQISIPSSIGSIQRDASIPQITSHPTIRICNLSLPVTKNLCLIWTLSTGAKFLFGL